MDFLQQLLVLDHLTEVVDIGANPIDGDPPYKPMLKQGLCRVTGFEPQPDALAKLNEAKGLNERYLPYAVGDGETHTLNVCRASGMTSLYELHPDTLEMFPFFRKAGEVLERVPVLTHALDNLPDIERLDFLKIDIQGAELSVFQHGRQKLTNAVMVQTELSFIPLYKDQPVLGDVDLELRRQGFVPHCFAAIKRWPVSPCMLNGSPFHALNQLLEADLVYMRDLRYPERFTDDMLKHMAMVAYHCYNSFDVSMRCIELLQSRGRLAPNAVANFTKAIPPERVPRLA